MSNAPRKAPLTPDDVLRRMLSSPPEPFTPKVKPAPKKRKKAKK